LEEITSLKKQNIAFTPNPEILLQAKNDSEFKALLEKANYLTPDGIGLYIAFQILDNNY
jgi:N-acetylglucosaminyldiphosphoundecaprenol N-acetyl-beta-D-mannosaminyltransferase